MNKKRIGEQMRAPKCMLTVDVEALTIRAPKHHVDTLIYGRTYDGEWGIGRIMDIADRHDVKMTFFLDFAEVERYGEEIIQAGKYVISRGHDLQIHCHYDLLEAKVRERFLQADRSYYAWYEDEAISDFIVDYCLEQYHKCTDKTPVIFRGGEYRFGKGIIKKLKEKGVAADASYNYIRPLKKPIHRQFIFENGLLEFPVGIVPAQGDAAPKPLNFNALCLYPTGVQDLEHCLEEYENLFRDFYDYYGHDAIAVMLMHSWSFCYEKERFQTTGFFDSPNPYAAEIFDCFLSHFKEKINFTTAAQAVQTEEIYSSETVAFDTVFDLKEQREVQEKLERMEDFIRQKAKKRRVVIWGNGWIEGRIMRVRDIQHQLDAAFYISQKADRRGIWRGKPVRTFEEAGIAPDRDYVLILANTCFPEIRDCLRNAGFREYEDYYDIASFPNEKMQ